MMAALLAAQGRDRFRQEQARLLRDPSFQFDFVQTPPPKPPEWLKWLGPLLKAVAPALPYVFWGAVILVASILVYMVARELLRDRGGGVQAGKVLTGSDLAPSQQRVKSLLQEADRLAGQGLFGEAARVLLHRTLDDLAERRPGLIAPDQTAREIAALDALPQPVREPLTRIAFSVERFLFAGHGLDRGAYEACRADYDRFLAAAAGCA